MQWLLYLLVGAAGVLNAVQAGCNATMRKVLDAPVASGLVIVAVSFSTMLVGGAVAGQLSWPAAGRFGQLPWWGWLGGVFGAFYVMMMLLTAEKIGAAVFMGVTVTAAVVASVALDHFGWVGFKEHPAGLARLAGAALMVIGVLLVARY
jgi:transporter family-2 protein